jgi:hypothetical protein
MCRYRSGRRPNQHCRPEQDLIAAENDEARDVAQFRQCLVGGTIDVSGSDAEIGKLRFGSLPGRVKYRGGRLALHLHLYRPKIGGGIG